VTLADCASCEKEFDLASVLRRSGRPQHGDAKAIIELVSNFPQHILDLRGRGYAGGEIRQHRAFRRIGERQRISWSAVALVALLTLFTLALLPTIARFWLRLLQLIGPQLGFEQLITARPRSIVPFVRADVPFIAVNAPLPSARVWWITALVTAAVLIGTLYIPKRHLPFTYLLRAMVFIQAVSLLYFALFGPQFPYNVPGYTSDMYTVGMAIMALIPVVFGLTYFVFDFGIARKLLIVTLSLAHLAVFIPLQFLVHAIVVRELSLLFLPILFMLFGVLIDVSVLIALYGWAMSWRDRSERAEAPAPLGPETTGSAF
jgi:hypothetical protein